MNITRQLVKSILIAAVVVSASTQLSAFVPISFKNAVRFAPIVVRAEFNGHDQLVVKEVLKGKLTLGVIEFHDRWDLYFQPEVGGTYLVALTEQLKPYSGPTACGTFNIMGVSENHLYYFSFYIPDEGEMVTLGFYEYNDDGSRATPEDVAKWISQHDDEAELERAG